MENKISMAFQKKYLSEEKYNYFIKEYNDCGKMLNGLENSLERYIKPNTKHLTPNT